MASDFRPLEILRVLLDEEVDFLVVGGIAVATYVTDRATGDIDIMVPTGDDLNMSRLERSLQRLDAELLGTQAGHGRKPASDDPYPTLLFSTRHGKLNVLYRPDGSTRYEEMRARGREITVLERKVRVAASDDLVRMKLAAGRRQDLDDVATLTTRGGARTPQRERRVVASWRLPASVDPRGRRRVLDRQGARGRSQWTGLDERRPPHHGGRARRPVRRAPARLGGRCPRPAARGRARGG